MEIPKKPQGPIAVQFEAIDEPLKAGSFSDEDAPPHTDAEETKKEKPDDGSA